VQQGRDIAGTAGQIEHPIATAHARGADEVALPQAVDAKAHQIVHQVVAVGHRRKHLADQLFLFAEWHVAEAEVSGFGMAFGFVHDADYRTLASRLCAGIMTSDASARNTC